MEAASTASFEAKVLNVSGGGASSAVAEAGDRGAELVEAWIGAKNAAAVAAIAEDEKAPAPARKAARRGINVLKARGVAIPERRHVAKLATDSIEGYEAWLIPPDGGGSSVVIVGARWQSGKYRLAQAVVREGVGLLEIRSAELSRAQLRTSFDESAKRVGYGPVPVPVEWARARIAAAKLDNAATGVVLPLGLDAHASTLTPVPDTMPPHPIDDAKLEATPSSTVVQTSTTLHGEPEFASWLPDAQAMQGLILDIGQRFGGESEREQSKVDAVVAEAVDAATDRFFGPDVRERLAARMKDSALSVLAREGKERAAQVLATAEAAKQAGLITSPPHEIPFLRAFFQKGLAMIAAQYGGRLEIPVPVAGAPAEGAPAPAT